MTKEIPGPSKITYTRELRIDWGNAPIQVGQTEVL